MDKIFNYTPEKIWEIAKTEIDWTDCNSPRMRLVDGGNVFDGSRKGTKILRSSGLSSLFAVGK